MVLYTQEAPLIISGRQDPNTREVTLPEGLGSRPANPALAKGQPTHTVGTVVPVQMLEASQHPHQVTRGQTQVTTVQFVFQAEPRLTANLPFCPLLFSR